MRWVLLLRVGCMVGLLLRMLTAPRSYRSALILGLVFGSAVLVVSRVNPGKTWDWVQYTASVVEATEGKAGAELHAATYAEMERTSGRLISLVGGTYREANYRDPEVFLHNRQSYGGRLAFTGPASGLALLGVPPAEALLWVSAVAGAAFAVLLILALPRQWWVWLLAIGVVSPALFKTARLGVPDTVLLLLVFGGMLLILRARPRLGLVLMILAMFARTDAAILVAFTATYLLAISWRPTLAMLRQTPETLRSLAPAGGGYRIGLLSYAAIGFTAVGVAVWLQKSYPHPGWEYLLYFSVLDLETDRMGPYSVSFGDYFRALGLMVQRQGVDGIPMLVTLFATIGLYAGQRRFAAKTQTSGADAAADATTVARARMWRAFTVIGLIYTVLHILLFPVIEIRFFILTYAVAVPAIGWTVAEWTATATARSDAAESATAEAASPA